MKRVIVAGILLNRIVEGIVKPSAATSTILPRFFCPLTRVRSSERPSQHALCMETCVCELLWIQVCPWECRIQIDCMEGGEGWGGEVLHTHRCMPAPFHHFACKFPQRLDGEGRRWWWGEGGGKGSMWRREKRGKKEV